MNQQVAIDLIRQALMATLWLSLPMLATLFVIGIAVSLLQTLTSIQDPSFSAMPRLAAALLVLFIALPWMTTKIVSYTHQLILNLPRYGH